MITDIVDLKKDIAQLQGENQAKSASIARLQTLTEELSQEVTYWKDEASKTAEARAELAEEQQKRHQLKGVYDTLHADYKKAQKLASHLRADGGATEKARHALQTKARILQQQVDLLSGGREQERVKRRELEDKLTLVEARVNDERANRLKEMHRMTREQIKAYEAERREREAVLRTTEHCQAADQLRNLLQQQETQVAALQRIQAYQSHELNDATRELQAVKLNFYRVEKTLKQKEERLVKIEYHFLEAQKECWRIQREALELVNKAFGGPRRAGSCKDALLTKPSLIQAKGFHTTTLYEIMTEHHREAQLLDAAMRSHKKLSHSQLKKAAQAGPCNGLYEVPPPVHPARQLRQSLPWEDDEDISITTYQNNLNEAHSNASLLSSVTYIGSRASEASSAPSLLQRIASGAKGPASIVNSPQLRNPMFDASHAHLLPSATASASSPSEKGRERSTLKVPGSLFVSTGLGMRKPEEDYFAANFSGSPRRMMQRALEAMEESEEEKGKSGKEMD